MQPNMVREETLRARYTEYRGRDPVEPRYKKKELDELHTVSVKNFHFFISWENANFLNVFVRSIWKYPIKYFVRKSVIQLAVLIQLI